MQPTFLCFFLYVNYGCKLMTAAVVCASTIWTIWYVFFLLFRIFILITSGFIFYAGINLNLEFMFCTIKCNFNLRLPASFQQKSARHDFLYLTQTYTSALGALGGEDTLRTAEDNIVGQQQGALTATLVTRSVVTQHSVLGGASSTQR